MTPRRGRSTSARPTGRRSARSSLGGPGDIPVSADYEGIGRADYAVYDPTHGVFLVRPSDGSATRTVAIGLARRHAGPGQVRRRQGRLRHLYPDDAAVPVRPVPGGGQDAVDRRPRRRPDRADGRLFDQRPCPGHRADGQPRRHVPRRLDHLQLARSSGPIPGSGGSAQFSPSDNGDVADATQNLLWRIENGELASSPRGRRPQHRDQRLRGPDRPRRWRTPSGVIMNEIHAPLAGDVDPPARRLPPRRELGDRLAPGPGVRRRRGRRHPQPRPELYPPPGNPRSASGTPAATPSATTRSTSAPSSPRTRATRTTSTPTRADFLDLLHPDHARLPALEPRPWPRRSA